MDDVSPAKVSRAERDFLRPVEMRVDQEILPWEMDLIERVCGDRRFHDVVVFTEAGGRLALIHKPSDPPGAFWAVTGGVEAGEELAQAVEREAYEETGLRVRPLRYVVRLQVVFTSGRRRRPWISHVFLAGLRQGQVGEDPGDGPLALSPVDVREVETARWVPLGEFRTEVVPVLAASGWGRFCYRLTLTRRLFQELGWETWE